MSDGTWCSYCGLAAVGKCVKCHAIFCGRHAYAGSSLGRLDLMSAGGGTWFGSQVDPPIAPPGDTTAIWRAFVRGYTSETRFVCRFCREKDGRLAVTGVERPAPLKADLESWLAVRGNLGRYSDAQSKAFVRAVGDTGRWLRDRLVEVGVPCDTTVRLGLTRKIPGWRTGDNGGDRPDVVVLGDDGVFYEAGRPRKHPMWVFSHPELSVLEDRVRRALRG